MKLTELEDSPNKMRTSLDSFNTKQPNQIIEEYSDKDSKGSLKPGDYSQERWNHQQTDLSLSDNGSTVNDKMLIISSRSKNQEKDGPKYIEEKGLFRDTNSDEEEVKEHKPSVNLKNFAKNQKQI